MAIIILLLELWNAAVSTERCTHSPIITESQLPKPGLGNMHEPRVLPDEKEIYRINLLLLHTDNRPKYAKGRARGARRNSSLNQQAVQPPIRRKGLPPSLQRHFSKAIPFGDAAKC